MKSFKLTTDKWFAGLLIAGSITYFAQQFNKSSLDEFIILVTAIGAGYLYYRLKPKIKIKNEKVKILAAVLILFITSAFLIGAFTAIDKTGKDSLETSTNGFVPGSIAAKYVIISGSTRTYFVSEVVSECSSSISNSKNAGLSPEQINKYCTCGANGIADITTLQEAESVKNGAAMSVDYRAKAEQIYTSCKQGI